MVQLVANSLEVFLRLQRRWSARVGTQAQNVPTDVERLCYGAESNQHGCNVSRPGGTLFSFGWGHPAQATFSPPRGPNMPDRVCNKILLPGPANQRGAGGAARESKMAITTATVPTTANTGGHRKPGSSVPRRRGRRAPRARLCSVAKSSSGLIAEDVASRQQHTPAGRKVTFIQPSLGYSKALSPSGAVQMESTEDDPKRGR
ncbi:unnamed protein product [Gadus morhua 'NCC']